ncbi:MAG: sulfatase [Flavobacteriaceae bacterium]
MKRLITFGILGCVALIFLNCQEKEQRPNVLFIAVDDLRPELGVYGNSSIHSPHIDAIAKEGAFFTHHYVHVPTCGASRYALLTGLRPSKPVHLTNAAIEKELSDKTEGDIPETFIHRLKNEGYHTVGIGKISHSADGFLYGYEENVSDKKELPHSWSELIFDPGKWQTGWNAFFGYASGENRQSLKKQVKPYEKGAVNDEGYVDGLTTKLALSKLRELKNSEKPFFMGIGFFKPHLPFNAPKKYWDLYERSSIPISENPNIPENLSSYSLHESGEFNQYALGEEKAGLAKSISSPYAQKLKHAYWASISYIDAQIGKIRKELKALDLDDNTIIILWGDHGWHLGDQRVWGKHTLFENALKSPLIIRSPQMDHRVNKIENIVETVDIYPTLLELCGLKPQHALDGESLVRTMTSKESSGEGTAYGYFRNGITVRTQNYRLSKYFHQDSSAVELYDHLKDPLETRNIAGEQPSLVEELSPVLKKANAEFISK